MLILFERPGQELDLVDFFVVEAKEKEAKASCCRRPFFNSKKMGDMLYVV